jgi:hypothetical protein
MRPVRPSATKFGVLILAMGTILITALLLGQVPQTLAASNSSPTYPAPGGTPAPHIITQFARGLTGARRILPQIPVPVPLTNAIDGCNHDYGEPGQCIPSRLPTGQTDWCSYLASHGLAHVKVIGRDSLALDQHHTGRTCL